MTESRSLASCPTCKKRFYWDSKSPWRPFCSERCRMIDLGEWLSEGHRIHGDPDQPTPYSKPDN